MPSEGRAVSCDHRDSRLYLVYPEVPAVVKPPWLYLGPSSARLGPPEAFIGVGSCLIVPCWSTHWFIPIMGNIAGNKGNGAKHMDIISWFPHAAFEKLLCGCSFLLGAPPQTAHG